MVHIRSLRLGLWFANHKNRESTVNCDTMTSTQKFWPGQRPTYGPSNPGMYSLPPYHEACSQADAAEPLGALPTHRHADVSRAELDNRWRYLRPQHSASRAEVQALDAAARRLYVRNRLIMLLVLLLLLQGLAVAMTVYQLRRHRSRP
ncbi:hypothetical protein HJFPF1_11618 [Paramyrothecium foliicola]|nr:hypothetical protein HJFPF1_11618 [Paramyrothecium foliicola]